MGVTVIMFPLLLLITVVSAVPIQDRAVTPHWVKICNTSLLFSEDSKTWEDAQGNCELYGGSLVQIRSMEMNYCILDYAETKALPAEWYWHSGNDIDKEGVYRYNRAGDFPPIAGDLILWSPIWAVGRPNGAKSENCLLVSLSSDGYAGQWADTSCTSPLRRYVCQRRL